MVGRLNQGFICLAFAISALLAPISGAHASFVTFSDITDGDGVDANYDAVATAAGAGGSNTLNIVTNNFTADAAAASFGAPVTASDTLSFTVTAPAGYRITSVSYAESGSVTTTQGVATASGSITADGIPEYFYPAAFNMGSDEDWSTGGLVNVANAIEVDVSIFNSLMATILGGPGSVAEITKSLASVTVGLAEVPIPTAVWLFGSALMSFVLVGRRNDRDGSAHLVEGTSV